MHTLRSAILALLVLGATAPSLARAQTKDDPEEFMRDVVRPVFNSPWTIFAFGGATTNGRFALQTPGVAGERELRSNGGWDVGGGFSVDILAHVGLRLTYAFADRDLRFRTANGDDSGALDVDDVGKLQTNVVSGEVIRYMLPVGAGINPYASVGLHGTWWNLDPRSTLVSEEGGSTQFRWGALATFGMLFRISDGFGMRLEASSASIGNPFTGRDSFRAFGGTTIDEPARVNQTDYRLVLGYTFGKP